MGKRTGGSKFVRMGGIAAVLLCCVFLVWAYDNHRWVINSVRGQSAHPSESPVALSIVKEDDQQVVPTSHIGFNAVETIKDESTQNFSIVKEDEHQNVPNSHVGLNVEDDIRADRQDLNLSLKSNADAVQCDLFTGKWVYDESYVLYPPGECPYSSDDFSCRKNGRSDSDYQKWRWQPRDCSIPRFNASDFLEKLRGKRLVYVGDSINRNQWESMLCLLRPSLGETGGSFKHTHAGKTISYVIKSYNCSIELSWAPFLVQQHKILATNETVTKETLRIDTIDEQADDWKHADILVFNTGHWWTHPEPYKGVDYFEEGEIVHPHMEEAVAFEKALRTWGRWIDANINPRNTQVFIRGYSPVHFNGKMWGKKEGGGCYNETEPIVKLEEEEARKNQDMKRVWTLEKVVRDMKIGVKLLNITSMSMYRKDAHSSVYNGRNNNSNRIKKNDYSMADCSHWCLPGLPDVWNHLLYALII